VALIWKFPALVLGNKNGKPRRLQGEPFWM